MQKADASSARVMNLKSFFAISLWFLFAGKDRILAPSRRADLFFCFDEMCKIQILRSAQDDGTRPHVQLLNDLSNYFYK